jgi:predicted nucleotidyltransferase
MMRGDASYGAGVDAERIDTICREFTEALRRILGEKLHGAYVYGAAAFPDDLPTGDIDFHVILAEELTEDERSELESFHASLATRYPGLGDLDGYYLLLGDARRESPPRSRLWGRAVDSSWALHRAHILAGRHVVLHGPDPREIYPPASWTEIEEALRGELAYVEGHLGEYPDYCILNLCRLIRTYETRDAVLSKAGASEWALGALPEWSRHVGLARKSYRGEATEEDRQFMVAEAPRFLAFAKERIERARPAAPREGE